MSLLGSTEIKLGNTHASPDVGVRQHDQQIGKSAGEFRHGKNVD